ncbi:hypothetical protein B0T09DRAFT_265808 [Sordaria sp. MPI-SDFR-AT-0083]|nr:hypothetical protein B0T09DRAFT_265808 [Sordaria sp. MPI-SDFR-AT-0083]
MHISQFLLPLTALLATATAAPYNLEQDADLIKRLEEAGARARADPNLEARFASAFYPRETSTPLKAVRSSSSSSSSDDTEIEDDLSTLPSLPYPGFNPYNLTLPDPSLYPLPPQNPHGPRNPNTPTPVLDSRNPSPVAEDYNGATPDRDQANYNGPYTYRTHYCGKPRIPADLAKVQDGEHYLYTLKGKPKIQGTKKKGQGWCVRNEHEIELQSYGAIAQAAYFLSGACFTWMGDRNRVAGQVFFGEKFNVAITMNKC